MFWGSLRFWWRSSCCWYPPTAVFHSMLSHSHYECYAMYMFLLFSDIKQKWPILSCKNEWANCHTGAEVVTFIQPSRQNNCLTIHLKWCVAKYVDVKLGRKRNTWPHSQPEVDDGESQGTPERLVHVLHWLHEGLWLCRPWKTVGDTEGYGSASTPDSVTEKAVHQPGSDSQNGVWRDRQHRHWERRATGVYPLTTAIQYICRKHNERGFGRMGEGNQHRREDGDEPEIRWRHNTARWDQWRLDRTCGKSQTSQWESRTIPECRENEGDDYRRHLERWP